MREEDEAGVNEPRFDDEYFDEDDADGIAQASLVDDVFALFEDGKTYAEAELAFQKSRLAFSLEKGRKGAALLLLAIGLVHLALVALVVGSVIALSPLLTPMGATLLVTAILLLSAVLFVRMAMRRFTALASAYKESRK